MNTRAKGMRIEALAEQQIMAQGFLIYRVKGSTKFNLNVDIFGLFDIMAINRLPEYTEVKLIQVKSSMNSVYGKLLNPFKAFAAEYRDAFDVEIWVWHGKDNFKVIKV